MSTAIMSNTTPRPVSSQTQNQNLPPTSIPSSPSTNLDLDLTTLPSFPLPTTWRCGTCTALHPVPALLSTPTPTSMTTVECCATPALQAVYDQFGALYLFWRDDPAVSDLRVPGMAEEARWRVRMAGGGLWEGLMTGDGGRVERARGMS